MTAIAKPAHYEVRASALDEFCNSRLRIRRHRSESTRPRAPRAGGAKGDPTKETGRGCGSLAQDARTKGAVRTLTGVIQVCAWLPGVLNPLRNRIWLQFVFHKLLRLLTPYKNRSHSRRSIAGHHAG